MRERLHPYIDENAMPQIVSRYHFRKQDEDKMQVLIQRLCQISEAVVYFADKEQEETRLAVLVTLGAGVDALQEEYTAAGQLTESYMIECIAMELLKNAYEQAADRIYNYYGLWMEGFDFLGERVPMEAMEEMFALLKPEEISYNQAYMLTPKKTVAFYTTLTDSRKTAYCNLCRTCSHTKCIHRKGNLTYGYQRIFGERGTKGK